MGIEYEPVISGADVCRARGQNHPAIISEPKQGGRPTRVLLSVEGRDRKTRRECRNHPHHRRLSPEQIDRVSPDMSPAYIKGISEGFEGALLVFDCFAVVQRVSHALEQFRRGGNGASFPRNSTGCVVPCRRATTG